MADKDAMIKVEPPTASTSSAFADNECAQALLDLAKSFSPPNGACRPKPEDLFSPDSLFSISSALYLNGASDKTRKRRDPRPGPRPSILKRQLEHSETRRSAFVASMENYDPQIAIKIECQGPEELRCELVKRIKLDHNYPCAGDFSWNRYVKALSHPSGDAPNKPQGKGSEGKGRKEHGPSSSQASGSSGGRVGKKTSPDQRYHNNSTKYHQVRAAVTPTKPKEGYPSVNNYATYHNPEGKNMWQPNSQNTPSVCQTEKDFAEAAGRSVACPELYQPNDSKYKNLNLLLKCLKTEEGSEDRASLKDESDSLKSNSTQDASEENSPFVENTFPECSEYQCMCCSRMFQQKRYMTKHMRRMHPEVLGGERRKEDTVTCPSCSLLVLRKCFKQHSNTCNLHMKKSKKQLEMDLANCQFCGIRMRRHILVRHLAQEHCVENPRDTSFYMDDSDSSTLSGSEHDDIEDSGDSDDSTRDPPKFQDAASWHSEASTNPASDSSAHQDPETTDLPATSSRETSPQEDRTNRSADSRVSCRICSSGIKQKENHNIDSETGSVKVGEAGKCTHSMLQRFLSESSSSQSQGEECRSCVQRLVSHNHDDDGYVSSNTNNNNNNNTRNADPVVTATKTQGNSSYTIFIPKDNQKNFQQVQEPVSNIPPMTPVLSTD